MQFNGEANNQDLYSQALWYCDASSNDYPINDFTRNADIAYHKAVVLIQSADGTFQYDDSNNTTLPIGYADLVSGQQEYSFDDSMLEIERVEIANTNGIFTLATPIDQSQIKTSLTEYKSTSGTPMEYDKVGRSMFLYPAPNYTTTGNAGIIVWFKRHGNIFDPTDTTKEPGFADAFHNIIALYCAMVYCLLYKPERVAYLKGEIDIMERDIKTFFSRRNKDVRRAIRGATVDTN